MYNERERITQHPNEIARKNKKREEEDERDWYYANDWPNVKAKLGKPYNEASNGELITQGEVVNAYHNADHRDYNALRKAFQNQFQTTTQTSNSATTKISQPGDAVEQHAEQVTKQVIENKQTENNTATVPSEETVTRAQDTSSTAPLALMHESENGTLETSAAFDSELAAAESGGFALPEKLRADLEARMGVGLAHVRIHTDAKADALARGINALAFTKGNHIYFQSGKYNPDTTEGFELLVHELVHAGMQGGGVARKAMPAKVFAKRYFAGVPDYSWDKLKQILGNGSTSNDEYIETILKTLIDKNPTLNPTQLWMNIITDPQILNGYEASKIYTGGSSTTSKFNRTERTLDKLPDTNAETESLENGTIDYTRRRHIVIDKKRKERKRKEASELATSFLQQTAGKINAVSSNVSSNKRSLEADLQTLMSDLNTSINTDALSKELQVFGMIEQIKKEAGLAKPIIEKYYKGSHTVINNNTEDQKKKLDAYTTTTVTNIENLHEDQKTEIKRIYDEFNANIRSVAGEMGDLVIAKGSSRYKKINTTKNGDSPLLKKGKQRAVIKEAYNANDEINELGEKTIEEAKGHDNVSAGMYDTYADFDAEMNKLDAIQYIYQTQIATNEIIDHRGETDKKEALNLMYEYYDKIDAKAIELIDLFLSTLQVYYDKINDYGNIQEGVINEFYTGAVSDLNNASNDYIKESKTQLEAFQNSQQGLRTPRKKKLQEQINLTNETIDPLLTQANSAVQKTNDEHKIALESLKIEIQEGFNVLASVGTTDFKKQLETSSASLEATKQEGVDKQLRWREAHLRQIIRDVKGAKREMKTHVDDLETKNQEQITTLNDELAVKLETFKKESQQIIDNLDERMDKAENQAEVDEESGDLQREQNLIDFKEANLKLTGTEECYKLYKRYSGLTHQRKRHQSGKKLKKELEELLVKHGLQPDVKAYGVLIASFEKGFRYAVSSTALGMTKIFEDKLNAAEKDYSNINNVRNLFDQLSDFRETIAEGIKYEAINNSYAEKGVPSTTSTGRGLGDEEKEKADFATKKVNDAMVIGRSQLKPLYEKHPIFDDESLLIQYRTPKKEIGSAKTPEQLQKVLLDYIRERKNDVNNSKNHLLENGGEKDMYSIDNAVALTMQNYGIRDNTVQNTIIQHAISVERTNQIVIGILVAIVSIALSIITLGTGTPVIVAGLAAAGMLAIDVYFIVDAVKNYEREKNLAGAGLLSQDPSMIWIFLAVGGALLDIGSLYKGLKAIQAPAQELAITGEVSKFEKAVDLASQGGTLEAKLADKIKTAARMREGYNNAAKSFYKTASSRLYTGVDPALVADLVKMAYYGIREGMAMFDQFLILAKQAFIKKGLMKLGDEFTPEELADLKRIWREAAGDVEKGMQKASNGSLFDNLKLGQQIGEGGNKIVYDIVGHQDEVIAVLKKGKPGSAIDEEVALLRQLSENNLPVVEILERGIHEGQPALIMKKYAQGSKDIVKRVGDKMKIVGDSAFLNQKSIRDLNLIKNNLINRKIKIDDLQFLIAKDGSIVIADPLAIFVGQAPSKWNLQMIDKLIEVASKKGI